MVASMRMANEVLDFLRVLAWPVAVVGLVAIFRGELRSLLGRLSALKTPWGSAKFGEKAAELADRAEELEAQVRTSATGPRPSAARGPSVAEPTVAFLDAYRALENAAREAADTLRLRHSLPVPVTRYLENRGLAPKGVGQLADQLRGVRNEVHSTRRLQEPDAQNLIEAVQSLAAIVTAGAQQAADGVLSEADQPEGSNGPPQTEG